MAVFFLFLSLLPRKKTLFSPFVRSTTHSVSGFRKREGGWRGERRRARPGGATVGGNRLSEPRLFAPVVWWCAAVSALSRRRYHTTSRRRPPKCDITRQLSPAFFFFFFSRVFYLVVRVSTLLHYFEYREYSQNSSSGDRIFLSQFPQEKSSPTPDGTTSTGIWSYCSYSRTDRTYLGMIR